MPTFEYAATNGAGQTVSGLLFASDEEKAMQDLAKRGLSVDRLGRAQSVGDPLAAAPSGPSYVKGHIAEVAVGTDPNPEGWVPNAQLNSTVEGPSTDQRSYMATSVWGPLVGKVPLSQLAFFFRQTGTMLHAGVPLLQILDTLGRQSQSPKLKSVIQEIRGHVEAGRPMTSGMQRYPEVFSPVMMSVIRIGESGGFLDQAFHQTADYVDREIALRNLYRRLTFLPKLELVAACIIIMGANAVIASLRPGAKGLSSPLTTLSTWYWLGPLLVVLFLFFRVGLANFGIKYIWDSFTSHVPYLGKTLRQLAMAKFGRAFAVMYASGVPLPQTMKLSADACGNEWMRARIYPAARTLETGAEITPTLAGTGVFSPIVLDMLRTGETTGSVDSMLEKVSDYYEHEAETRAYQFAQVAGVAIAICVMIYIGYVVISFYMGFYGGMMKEGLSD